MALRERRATAAPNDLAVWDGRRAMWTDPAARGNQQEVRCQLAALLPAGVDLEVARRAGRHRDRGRDRHRGRDVADRRRSRDPEVPRCRSVSLRATSDEPRDGPTGRGSTARRRPRLPAPTVSTGDRSARHPGARSAHKGTSAPGSAYPALGSPHSAAHRRSWSVFPGRHASACTARTMMGRTLPCPARWAASGHRGAAPGHGGPAAPRNRDIQAAWTRLVRDLNGKALLELDTGCPSVPRTAPPDHLICHGRQRRIRVTLVER